MKKLTALAMMALISLSSSHTVFGNSGPCEEFSAQVPTSSGWLLADCLDVWASWKGSLGDQDNMWPGANPSLTVEENQEKQLLPCEVQSAVHNDGAGSRTMRYLADWIVAEELGCRWIGTQLLESVDGGGVPTLYCHGTVRDSQANPRGTSTDVASAHCSLVNWLEFFNLGQNMAEINESIPTEHVSDLGNIFDTHRHFIDVVKINGGIDKLSWKQVRFENSMRTGTRTLTAGAWNPPRREAARHVLDAFRKSYWQHARSSFQMNPTCEFSTSRLDVALHVRLGDRNEGELRQSNNMYFDLLEAFMDSVSLAAVSQGQPPPMFHVFSEVESLCPSSEDRAFEEFSRWPIESQEVELCAKALIPSDCPEKEAGAPACKPSHSGIFRVQDRPLILHVGLDVQNDLECMVQADAILMGCSTFGHVAGILSKGLKFFSVHCEGMLTAPHHKMIPPLAAVEHGHLWIPISGSWRDPVVMSGYILNQTIAQLVTLRDSGTLSHGSP